MKVLKNVQPGTGSKTALFYQTQGVPCVGGGQKKPTIFPLHFFAGNRKTRFFTFSNFPLGLPKKAWPSRTKFSRAEKFIKFIFPRFPPYGFRQSFSHKTHTLRLKTITAG